MVNLSTKVNQFSYKLKHNFFTLDRIIFCVAVILCFAWTCGSIASMSRNWELVQELAARQKDLALIQLEVDTLELENEYYASAEYQELAARRLKNKIAPGETMIYLSDNSEAAKTKHQETETAVEVTDETDQNNFEQWLFFLFGA